MRTSGDWRIFGLNAGESMVNESVVRKEAWNESVREVWDQGLRSTYIGDIMERIVWIVFSMFVRLYLCIALTRAMYSMFVYHLIANSMFFLNFSLFLA